MSKSPQEISCDNAKVHIDVNLIPQHTQENLARATLDAFLRFMERPDARKILDEEKAELGL